MLADICPKVRYITPARNTAIDEENDIFESNSLIILKSDLTQIRKITSTAVANRLQARLLCCYQVKDFSENYCTPEQIDKPRKQVCSDGVPKNRYVHFHLKLENIDDNEYLIAFIKRTDFNSNNINALKKEIAHSIAWLEITSQYIFVKIFKIGEPAFSGTNTIAHYQKELCSEGNVKVSIAEINRNFRDSLTVSLENNLLSFVPS